MAHSRSASSPRSARSGGGVDPNPHLKGARGSWEGVGGFLSRDVGKGGAQLILAPSRAHLWPFVPSTLRKQPAVMGGDLPAAERRAINGWARRPMSAGEVGILRSNAACWQHAIDCGWEWSLVLEDDAKVGLPGKALQLLALLPELVASAKQQDGEWQVCARARARACARATCSWALEQPEVLEARNATARSAPSCANSSPSTSSRAQ